MTAREQAREAVHVLAQSHGFGLPDAADAASDVWEPLVEAERALADRLAVVVRDLIGYANEVGHVAEALYLPALEAYEDARRD